MVSRTTLAVLGSAALVLATVTACAPADEATPTPVPPPGAAPGTTAAQPAAATGACAPGTLQTLTSGKLTVGTDNPAFAPWVIDNKPESGKGFESAVAYAVATRLGYAKEAVTWVRVPFNNAIAPGPKKYDFDINQFSITDTRKKAVDFSSPYYLVRQTVITTKGSKVAGATSVSDLKDAKLGAQVGTTSLDAIKLLIKPAKQAQVFNSNDDAVKALQNKTVDGLVVDLPTAFYMTGAQLDDGVIVGQLPQVGVPEQFGLVLDKNSKLTGCITGAVDQLRQDGTLAELEKTWLGAANGAKELP